MLLILEIGMLLGGIYSAVTAKVPAFILDGGNRQVEGRMARIIGVLLMLPLTVAISGGIFSSLFVEENAADYVVALEFLTLFVVVILTLVSVRVAGNKIPPVSPLEATIKKKAQGSLMYAMFSATGFAAVICCPLAFIYSSQALKLIDEYDFGKEYRGKAKAAQVIAGIAMVFWVALVIGLTSFLFAIR